MTGLLSRGLCRGAVIFVSGALLLAGSMMFGTQWRRPARAPAPGALPGNGATARGRAHPLWSGQEIDRLISVGLVPGWVGGLGPEFRQYARTFDEQGWLGENVTKVTLQDMLASGVEQRHADYILIFAHVASRYAPRPANQTQALPPFSLPAVDGGPATGAQALAQRGRLAFANISHGLSEGTCLSTALTFKGGSSFAVELRSSPDPHDRACRLNGEDVLHLHLRFGNSPIDGKLFAVAGSGYNTGSGFQWLPELRFEEPFAGRLGERQELTICLRQKQFVVAVRNVTVATAIAKWDWADISCLSIENKKEDLSSDLVEVEQVWLSNAPTVKECHAGFARCAPMPTAAFPPPPVEFLQAFYINLARRPDKRRKIERQLKDARISFSRVEAFDALHEAKTMPSLLQGCWDGPMNKVCAGQIGCQRSHLKVIDLAMEGKLPFVAVFEDDFIWVPWLNKSRVQGILAEMMHEYPDWDVIALSLNIASETIVGKLQVPCQGSVPCVVSRIHNAQTTGGYILRDSVYAAVRYRFSDEHCKIKENYQTAIDTCWKPLQQIYNFYAFEPQLGTQRKGFSDIESREVDYKLHRRM